MVDLKSRLTPHFFVSEFFVNPADKWAVGYFRQNEKLFYSRMFTLANEVLEPLRARFGGKAVVITSGLRSPIHNKAVGGAKLSEHLTARAVDIYVVGVPLKEVYAFLATLPRVGGLAMGPGFVHVDTRPRVGGQIVRWTY